MASKKSITEAPAIADEAYYAVQVSARFKALGVGFGQQSETQVTGALLKKLLETDDASKVIGYTPV
ncbi:hypothetical protein IP86_10760 [Rhodopseudomonas sp. AAP120]|uniref:hypothetical protein n=1 Tax=Rhodopseudomonas sp. AAP120 TaxID=1523430 RepID=UPI0006B908D9|nr:hypothetical protein [Rhodopseudomonas sp. AAP120]KPF98803.1 hypothetical protein IP86_10760 [Rhodopseudomonas sp. AAP120]